MTRIQIAEMLTAFPVYSSDESLQRETAERLNTAVNQLADLVSLSNSHGSRIELLSHYQRGLDAFVLAGHMGPMSEHLREFKSVHQAVLQEFDSSEAQDPFHDQLLQTRLNQLKHAAQAAMFEMELDPSNETRANAIRVIQSAVDEFSDETAFVEANPLLANDFGGLQRMLNHLKNSTPERESDASELDNE